MCQVWLAVEATASLRYKSVFSKLLGRNDFDGIGFELVSFFRVADASSDVHGFIRAVQVKCDRWREANETEKLSLLENFNMTIDSNLPESHIAIEEISEPDVVQIVFFVKRIRRQQPVLHQKRGR